MAEPGAFDEVDDIHLVFGADLQPRVTLQERERIPPAFQDIAFEPDPPEVLLQQIKHDYLTWRLDGPSADVNKHGEVFFGQDIIADPWSTPLPISSRVQAIPPDDSGFVGFEEIEIEDDLLSMDAHALESTKVGLGLEIVGNDAEPATAASTISVEEARGWLQGLSSGAPLKALAPGMQHGLLGAWAQEDRQLHAEEGLADTTQTDRGGTATSISEVQQLKETPKLNYSDILDGLWLVDDDQDGHHSDEDGGQEAGGPRSALSQVDEFMDSSLEGASSTSPGDVASDGLGDILKLPTTIKKIILPKTTKRFEAKQHDWAQWHGIPDVDRSFNNIRDNLALDFPFKLDRFQKEGICCLETGQSVFVAAHTSAGKTVVAEYAFALAMKHHTRAVYTSPIKTISNQKFRDFSSKFDVGIMTGDVQIKPDASCLIVTTEILRSMLYKGADLVRDMEYVIFDEVHYVNDAERGVVWEETIIMLPPHCTIVLLSATVPNVMEFADWVGRTKQKIINVTGTFVRPVPLEHFLYFNSKMFKICSAKGIRMEGLKEAVGELKRQNAASSKDGQAGDGGGRGRGANTQAARRGRGQGRGSAPMRGRSQGYSAGGRGPNKGGPTEKAQIKTLIHDLMKKELLPVVFFCFSKKRCDECTDRLGSLDFTTAQEKHAIHQFCEKSLSRLSDTDRKLPQLRRIKDLLKRGLAVHHAGMLPIVKEIVEMLFCDGMVKVLFATETFAMGVNAPARTVVFHSLRKHDGRSFRTLLSGEYTQMAGRAGRRGLDDVGTVIIACWEDLPEESDVRELLQGRGVHLSSQFRLTYSMILNLMRVEDLKVEDMLKRSFAEFHAQKGQPGLLAQVDRAERKLKLMRSSPWPDCYKGCSREVVEKYCELLQCIEDVNRELMPLLLQARKMQETLTPGRIILFSDSKSSLIEIGVICGSPDFSGAPRSRSKAIVTGSSTPSSLAKNLYVLSLRHEGPWDSATSSSKKKTTKKPAATSGSAFDGMVLKLAPIGKGHADVPFEPQTGEVGGAAYAVSEIEVETIVAILPEKLQFDAEKILQARADNQNVHSLVKKMVAMQEQWTSGQPADISPKLAPGAVEVPALLVRRQRLLDEVLSLPPHQCTCLSTKYASVRTEQSLVARLRLLRHKLSDDTLQQMPDFEQRVEVLQRLSYLDKSTAVQLKGRVACEINSAHELVATEMIFTGLLSELRPEEAVAVLSAFVFQDKSQNEPHLTDSLQEARDNLSQLAYTFAVLQSDCGLPLDPTAFCKEVLNFGLVEVVYEWARGTPFHEICGLTDIMEGSIVRTIVRLEQTCRELRDAARVMGNTSLFQQMQDASALIKRDVIFAASLYVS